MVLRWPRSGSGMLLVVPGRLSGGRNLSRPQITASWSNFWRTRGIPQEYIRRLIRNPQTGRPVSIKTLERAFATDKTAKVEFACQVARFVIDTILGRETVNAKPVKNERLRLTLPIFYAKTHGLFM